MVEPARDGEVGAVARHALRMYSEVLEASTETSRFIQMMTLIEFLAAPNDFCPDEARQAHNRAANCP